ncbi:hypothetical protein AgCh_025542 [Apium graveolens]
MTGDSTLLTEFKERAGPSITFGDDNKGYTVGYGLISKDNVIIEEVALVDGLKHNLLSISQLCDKVVSLSPPRNLSSLLLSSLPSLHFFSLPVSSCFAATAVLLGELAAGISGGVVCPIAISSSPSRVFDSDSSDSEKPLDAVTEETPMPPHPVPSFVPRDIPGSGPHPSCVRRSVSAVRDFPPGCGPSSSMMRPPVPPVAPSGTSSPIPYHVHRAVNTSFIRDQSPEFAAELDQEMPPKRNSQPNNGSAGDPSVSDMDVSFKPFQAVKPPEFKGEVDPVAARIWLKEMEKAFALTKVSENLKTDYASYFLRNDSNYWWESTRAQEGEVSQGVPFRPHEFDSSSFQVVIGDLAGQLNLAGQLKPPGLWLNIQDDGGKKIELKPGFYMEHDENVGAVVVGFDRYFNYYKVQKPSVYEAKFTELARIAPEYVSSEAQRAKQFQQGLKPEIRSGVVALQLKTYTSVVQVALVIKSNQKLAAKEQGEKKKKCESGPARSEAGIASRKF